VFLAATLIGWIEDSVCLRKGGCQQVVSLCHRSLTLVLIGHLPFIRYVLCEWTAGYWWLLKDELHT